MLEPPLEPFVNEFEEYELPQACEEAIRDICVDIAQRGSRSRFTEIYDLILEHIREDVREILLNPEGNHGD